MAAYPTPRDVALGTALCNLALCIGVLTYLAFIVFVASAIYEGVRNKRKRDRC